MRTAKRLLLAAGLAGLSVVPSLAQTRSDDAIDARPARPGITAGTAGSVSGAPTPPAAATAEAQPATEFATSVSIPTITAVGSSMDEAALRDTLSGGFANHVEELAKLTANSITIPEITLSISIPGAEGGTNTIVYRDIVLTDVTDGVAASVSVGSTSTQSEAGMFTFGKLQASSFDLGGLLGLYGFVPGTGGGDMRVVYKDFSFDGGSVDAGAVKCSFGKVTVAEFSARPLSVSWDELITAGETLEAAGDAMPPEAMGTVVRFLTDIFQAFQSTPTSVGEMSCTGTDDSGKPFEATVGGISMDGYSPGIYPAITVSGLKISTADQGSVSLDSATLKAIDLTPTLAALNAEGAELTEKWFEENGRKLIPAVGGFAMSGLKIDVVNADLPGGRVQASIGSFDLTLGNYVNGIPTLVSTSASGIDMPIPDDPDLAPLRQLGIERVNLGYELNAHWDEAAQTLNIDRVAINGETLGSAAVALHLGSATAALFDLDPDVQMQAGLSVTIKDFSLDLTDSGLGDVLLPLAGQQQGLTPEQFREQMAAGVEGLAVQTLGRSDSARALGAAIGDFVAGTKKSLSIRVTAKDVGGVPLAALMNTIEGADNPMALIPVLNALIDITGSAQ